MDSNLLFTSALAFKAPWQVSDIRFEPEQVAIHFDLVCESKRLACPVCDQTDQPIHERSPRTWQHPHFFQYQASCMPRCRGSNAVIAARLLRWTCLGRAPVAV